MNQKSNGLTTHVPAMIAADGGSKPASAVAVVVAVAVPPFRSALAVTLASVNRGDTEPVFGGSREGVRAMPFVSVGPLSLNASSSGDV